MAAAGGIVVVRSDPVDRPTDDRSQANAQLIRIGVDELSAAGRIGPSAGIVWRRFSTYRLLLVIVLLSFYWSGIISPSLLMQILFVFTIAVLCGASLRIRALDRRLVVFCVVDRNTRTIELRFVREDAYRGPMTLGLDGLSFIAFRGLSKDERDGAGIDLYVGETYTVTVGKYLWPSEDLHTLERHLRALGVPSRTDGMVLEATAWKERFLSKYPEFRRKK